VGTHALIIAGKKLSAPKEIFFTEKNAVIYFCQRRKFF
jgi:hypothetical protein